MPLWSSLPTFGLPTYVTLKKYEVNLLVHHVWYTSGLRHTLTEKITQVRFSVTILEPKVGERRKQLVTKEKRG